MPEKMFLDVIFVHITRIKSSKKFENYLEIIIIYLDEDLYVLGSRSSDFSFLLDLSFLFTPAAVVSSIDGVVSSFLLASPTAEDLDSSSNNSLILLSELF